MLSESIIRQVSVVVPVRNRPELLDHALTSLAAQDFPAHQMEVIVCDDGSTDDIQSVVSRFQSGAVLVKLVAQPPTGPAAARNLGIRASIAPIILFVDSDVVADRSLVRKLVEALADHPLWQGAEAALKPAGGQEGILWDAPASVQGGHYHTAAIAYRRAALVAVGGFDEGFKLPACEDVELAMCILKLGEIGFVFDAVAWHPRRRVTALTHWRWRRHWYYEMILAARYGILAFPEKPCGSLYRMRLAWAAVVTLPAGRFLGAVGALTREPVAAVLAGWYAILDVAFGAFALPDILWAPVPDRRRHLEI